MKNLISTICLLMAACGPIGLFGTKPQQIAGSIVMCIGGIAFIIIHRKEFTNRF